jgi:hypothetical protein
VRATAGWGHTHEVIAEHPRVACSHVDRGICLPRLSDAEADIVKIEALVKSINDFWLPKVRLPQQR